MIMMIALAITVLPISPSPPCRICLYPSCSRNLYFDRHGFRPNWVLYHVQHSIFCEPDDKEIPEAALTFLRDLVDMRPAAFREVHRLLKKSKCECTLRKKKFHRLMHAVARFNGRQRRAWKQLWNTDEQEIPADFLFAIFTWSRTISPHRLSSEVLIRSMLQKFRHFLTELFERQGEPAVVTLSRSMTYDHYLPKRDLRLVEDGLLDLLQSSLAPRKLKVICYTDEAGELGLKELQKELSEVSSGRASSILRPDCHLYDGHASQDRTRAEL